MTFKTKYLVILDQIRDIMVDFDAKMQIFVQKIDHIHSRYTQPSINQPEKLHSSTFDVGTRVITNCDRNHYAHKTTFERE